MDTISLILCPHCQEAFRQPVLLPCKHSVCKDCATHLYNEEIRELKCPVCSSVQHVLNIAQLEPNLQIKEVLAEIHQIKQSTPIIHRECKPTNEELTKLEEVLFSSLTELKTSKETAEAHICRYYDELAEALEEAKRNTLLQLSNDYKIEEQLIEEQIDVNQTHLENEKTAYEVSSLFLECEYETCTNSEIVELISSLCCFKRYFHTANAIKAIRILGLNQEYPNAARTDCIRHLSENPAGIESEKSIFPLAKSRTVINELSSNLNLPLAEQPQSISNSLEVSEDIPLDLLEHVFPTKFLHKEVCLEAVQGGKFADLPLENTAGIEEMLGESGKTFDFAIETCENISAGLEKCHIEIIEEAHHGTCEEYGEELVELYNRQLKAVNKFCKRIANANEEKAEFLASCKNQYLKESAEYVEELQNLQREYIEEKEIVCARSEDLKSLSDELKEELMEAAADESKALQFRVCEAKLEEDIQSIRKIQTDFVEFEALIYKETRTLLDSISQLEQERSKCLLETLNRNQLLVEMNTVIQNESRIDFLEEEFRMLYNALLLEPVEALLPLVMEESLLENTAIRQEFGNSTNLELSKFSAEVENLPEAPTSACGLAICEFPFTAEGENEICLIAGEKYWVFEVSDWAVISPFISPNIRGMAPWNHLKPLSCENAYVWDRDIGIEFGGVLMTKRCVFNFTAEEEGEINLEEDDIIEACKAVNDDWIWGKNRRTGEEGRFPKTFVA